MSTYRLPNGYENHTPQRESHFVRNLSLFAAAIATVAAVEFVPEIGQPVKTGLVSAANSLPGATYAPLPRHSAPTASVSPRPTATVTETVTATPSVTPSASPNQLAPASPTETATKISKVLWILEENHGYNQVMNPRRAPYISELAQKYGYVEGTMHAETHPSLGNYLDLSTGRDTGVHDDKDPAAHPITAPNIWRQSKTNWTALLEGMPENCATNDGGNAYVVRHNPPAYMATPTDKANCAKQDMPLTSYPGDLSKALTLVAPNKQHDMHDGTIREGDNWLRQYLGDPDHPAPGTVFASPEYREGMAVIITWDEDDKHSSQIIPTIVVSPDTHNVASVKGYSHYDILAATEDVLGLPYLGAGQNGVPFASEADGHSTFAKEFGLIQ